MATDSNVLSSNGYAVQRAARLRSLTILAHASNDSDVTVRDGGASGTIRWRGKIVTDTTQHFVFPDNMGFAQDIYVAADNWGEVTVGYI